MSPMKRSPLTIEHALLGFLAQQPMHGYEIYQRLSEAQGLGLVWHIKQSQLYALLGKLEGAGYIEARREPQENRPPRKVYELTESGVEAFQHWLESPVPRGRKLRLEFMAKLYFARRQGDTACRRLLDAQQAACQEWLTAQRHKAKALRQSQPYEWLVHRFRIGQIQAMLDWLETCESALASSVPVEGE